MEIIKKVQIAKITLRNDKPLIQVIDEPFFLFVKEKLGKTKGIILEGIIGIFLATFSLTFINLFRIILQ